MIINDTLKTIYLHNSKTGGTFFRGLYERYHSHYEAYQYWKLFDKDINVDLGHIDYNNIARFVPDYREFRIITMIRNPYNRFVSAWKEACPHHPVFTEINDDNQSDIEKISKHILSLNFYDQDLLLRNKQIPWLTPQSYFIREHTIVLRYEDPCDWKFLLNVFAIPQSKVMIRNDYQLGETAKKNIRALYPEDAEIFELYEQKN